MSYSWLNNSQNSTGFVYYNLDTTPTNESPDFLKFSESSPSPQSRRFNPTSFSSPYHNRRGSPRGYNKRNRIYSGNQQNAFSASYSPNSSYSKSPYNNSSWVKSRENSFNNKSRDDSFTMSNLLHPSFTEDPWADLEKKLDYKEKQKNISHTLNQSTSSTLNKSSGSYSNKRDLSEMT